MEQLQCFMCLEESENCTDVYEITTHLEDGSLVKPVDVLLRVFDGWLKIAKNSQCCMVCMMSLSNFAILERKFAKAKNDLKVKLSSFSKTSGDSFPALESRRRKIKPKWFSSSGSNEDDLENVNTFQIELSQDKWGEVEQNFEARLDLFKDCLKCNVEPLNPGCSFSGITDSKSSCLSKQCGVEVHFELNSVAKCVTVVAKGQRADHEQKDPSRITFELTKGEFTDECICEFCCEKFASDELLGQHLKLMNEMVYKCPLCSNESKTFQARNTHFLSVHTSDSPYKCKNENCSLSFKTRGKKNQHEKTCLYHIRYPCAKCDKSFVTRRNLREHHVIAHDRQRIKFSYKCDHCDKPFYKKCNYENHIITHDRSGKKPFECPTQNCGLSFRRLRTLNDHIRAKHDEMPKMYLCAICGQKFDSNTGYKQHLAKHSGLVYIKRNYSCQDCGKSFRAPSDLQIHRVVHTKEKAFACDMCKAQFTQKASLKDHYNVHLKLFQCGICKKAFGRQRYLDNHTKSCNGQSSSTTKETASKSTEIIIRLNTSDESQQVEEVAYTITSAQ